MSHIGDEESLILTLPPDVLLLIFSYCDIQSLGTLSRVCKHFYNIATEECLWLYQSRQALVTNQFSNDIKSRSYQILSARDKCRLCHYWKRAVYKEECLFRFHTKFMPWLQLRSDKLWISKGNLIHCYRRKSCGLVNHKPLYTLRGHAEDICRFVQHSGKVVSGGRDGNIFGWSDENGRLLFIKKQCHSSDINCIDMNDSVIISGSRDRNIQLWSIQNQTLISRATVHIQDRVWSVAIGPNKRTFAVGSAGYFNVAPFQVYDMENLTPVQLRNQPLRNGAGVLDICYESPAIMLTAGYDTFIRMWDLRTNSCVAHWEDPHDSVIYSLCSDKNFTILSGTALHGLVRLWDKRSSKSVQMYYVGHGNSPVYSTCFDPCYLYVALDNSVCLLKFGQLSKIKS